ncbi:MULTISPECIES: hypothetical protein [Bradyrhizobium]|uniref:SGNH hydrolase-type esterase domain-containing protein n=1 Tax=Bradyrhizobium denitrificans TaxID=2734912 RepID=A0ABS5G6Y9_9BRAD|nr:MULTISPECIES: hypothetical protein [Bradyrhizobium]RTM01826.1 MAG: hypothetical protein EKK32_12675 [Bradyrhizobiaceae bacterium]MBR1137089.1 hypothetical protein [Bradyrhizobium denitrificans]MCL8483253.1 hypothetical protein [Bradyrhizobium denitrificans]MDU1495574.1 hypothetical protein [Bradyrhizobium sp.]MDU1542491.1 hypothetical protein [Bradyrhizobium sp.]
MARYVAIVIALFVAAFIPLLVVLEWAGWRLGATIPLSTIASEQSQTERVVWLGSFKDYAPYKLERIKRVQPEVLLVGSSRCGQARAQMFRPYVAYNACLTAWPLTHVVDFIDRATRVAKPRIVIVALDYFLFGDFLAEAWQKERTMDFSQGLDSHRRKLHDVADFVIRNNGDRDAILAAVTAPQTEPVDGNRLVGTEAIRGKFGFRQDGSVMVAPPYRRIADETLSRGPQYVTSSFPGAPQLSERQFGEIERLSRLAHERQFQVIAIQYPFLESAAAFLDTNESYWPYSGIWRDLKSEQTANRFARLGISFFDMSRTQTSQDPNNFFDPAHPSERGMLKTYLALLEKPDFAKYLPRIDRSSLAADLDRGQNEQFDLYH